MQLATTLVSGALMAMIGTAGSSMMVETYKGSAKAELRSRTETAFRLVQKHIDNQSVPEQVNNCSVDSIGDYGAVEEFTREVTVTCALKSGAIKLTTTRLVVCEPCSQQAAATTVETTPPEEEPSV